jgi:intracellular multiplication protein IcmD
MVYKKGSFVRNAHLKKQITFLTIVILYFVCSTVFAAQVNTIGDMAALITKSFANIAKLITAISYLGGIGFALGAVMKFKQHKDNPTQIPVGTPIAMLFIASALLFFPVVLNMTGMSIFGTVKTAGPSGIIWGQD